MAKTLQIQTNFTSGELTPRLWAHVDVAKYKNGLKEATNCTILPHGPVRRRNGFKFINEVKDSTKNVRLIRFEFDQSDAYILEVGDLYIRFYTNGGQVLSGGVPYEVTTTYTKDEIFQITYVQFGRLLYIFHANHAPAQLVWTSSASWVLSDVIFYPSPTSEEGIKPSSTLTPSATSGTGINFTAVGTIFTPSDVGRQLHNLVGAGIAAITAYTSSTVVVCTILTNFPNTSAIASGNWKIDLSPLVSVTPSGSRIGALVTLTAAATAWTGAEINTPNYYLINNGVVKTTLVGSGTVLTGEVQKSLDAITATANWTSEVPIWNSTFGYPAVCALHQQRLWAASTSNNPQRVWASESGILTSFGAGSSDSDALDFNLSNKEVSKVSWLGNIRGQLAIGTTSSELTIDSGTAAGPITPTNLIQQVRGYNGSNLQQPIGLDDEILYIQRSGKKINAFSYNFQLDNYVSTDLLFLAEHMPGDLGVKELAYAHDPDRNIYAVLNDGDLLVCTYVKEQEVTAWTRYSTDGNFESINTISTGINDEVWVVVKRTINGSTKRYIEKLDISTGESNTDGFSDCYLTYSNPKTITAITNANPGVVTSAAHGFSNGDFIKFIDVTGMSNLSGKTFTVGGAATNSFNILDSNGSNINTTSFGTFSTGTVHKLVTTISGLSYLEGKTVQVKADGAKHIDCTVSSGSITLNQKSYEVTVGIGYTTTITTLVKEYNQGEGSMQGQKVRWIRPVIRLYQSVLPTINGQFLPARAAIDRMDNKLGLYTGDAVFGSLTWKDGFSSSLTISSSDPLPMTLLGIFGSMEGGSE